MTAPDLSFAEALAHLMNGVRMAARFMPDNIFIELQKPGENAMNTEPYLKMVKVTDKPNADGSYPHVVSCEPWEPGRRSLFSHEWYTSQYQGIPVAP